MPIFENFRIMTTVGMSIFPMMLSCGQKEGSINASVRQRANTVIQSDSAFQAPKDMTASFILNAKTAQEKATSHQLWGLKDRSSFSETQSGAIAIKKSSLDKEFLLRTSIIEGGTAPSFQSLKSRIVAFTKKGASLFLMEATAGHAFYQDLPQKLILAEFPIVKEKDNAIYFDFDAGMTKIFVMEDWYAQDVSGASHPTFDEQFRHVSLGHSFIDSMTFTRAKDTLFITQVAQLAAEGSSLPVEIRYALQAYEPNPHFQPQVSPKEKKYFGFFETTPTISIQDKKAKILATKFDTSKPITFAISDNTPDEYREAIREGVLYWNKAFGYQALQVIDAPPGVTAPDYHYNVIQWIDWKDANYAFADAQIDPRSGEILNAQIYLSSVFAVHGIQEARALMREALAPMATETQHLSGRKYAASLLKKIAAQPESKAYNLHNDLLPSTQTHEHKHLSLRHFGQKPLCQHHHLQSLAMAMMQLRDDELNEGRYLKISQDHVRETVAHEVGHTLGLRHNFAGITAANYHLKDREAIFASYLKTGSTPENLMITSSVMDYIPFQEAVMSGDQVKKASAAHRYDQLAIQTLYHGLNSEEVANPPLFCTDSQLSQYVDCKVWNTSPSPLAAAKWQTTKNIANFPKTLAEYFISHVKSVPAGEEKLPFDHILVPTVVWSLSLLAPRLQALETLTSSSRALWLDRKYGYVTESNSEAIDKEFASWVREQLEQEGQGKWANILDHIPNDFAQKVTSEFAELISSEAYRRGVGPGGSYEFSDAEIARMIKAVGDYMREMENSLMVVDILQLYSLSNISNKEIDLQGTSLDEGVASYFRQKVQKVLFAFKERADKREGLETEDTLLTTLAKAKLVIKDPLDLIKKVGALKSLDISEWDMPSFVFDDRPSQKTYSEKEINTIASTLLAEKLEAMATESNLMSLLTQAGLENTLPSLVAAVSPTAPSEASSEQQDPDAMEVDDEEPAAPSPTSKTESHQRSPLAIEVPIALQLPVSLIKFKYEYWLRLLAAGLLNSQKGESMAFGMQERDKLERAFLAYHSEQMRGLKVPRRLLAGQSKALNIRIQEDENILRTLSGTNLLTKLLELL